MELEPTETPAESQETKKRRSSIADWPADLRASAKIDEILDDLEDRDAKFLVITRLMIRYEKLGLIVAPPAIITNAITDAMALLKRCEKSGVKE